MGLIPGRHRDRLGFGVAAAHLGSDFRQSLSNAGTSAEDWEIALELKYFVSLTPWLSIRPDLQYVIHPGGDRSLQNALSIGVRLTVSL